MDFLCESPWSYPAAASLPIALPSSNTVATKSSSSEVLGVVSQTVGRFISAAFTCICAVVGMFVGAVAGALTGLATESGLFRGAGIGAISGAVFSIEAVESSLVLWQSEGAGIWSILYAMDIISSLLSGRIIRERVGPAVQSAVRSQMSAVDAPFEEVLDLFETGGTIGMSSDSVDSLPTIFITTNNNADTSGERITCSVCLQDFQLGETARCLPQCQHMFHLPCIDNWLIRHGSCPLCRRDF